ncbi:magnesium-translocating P-type ATPase, partial [Bacteroides cellulosilyticus]|nr:magnesium-translocating P-type ATPase [Bacteroides cellulosilyticus]
IFAISVAVGLTPEMLPMIVTANLSKGALSMSKKKTIVKNLNAIQNFGAMNILCTDKTVKLKCDKIVLEKYITADGSNDESKRILRHAYFNSYFQSGLKNLMDKA